MIPSRVTSAAARMGSTAFFAVLTLTSPESRGEWQIKYCGMGFTSAKIGFAVIVPREIEKLPAGKRPAARFQQDFFSISV